MTGKEIRDWRKAQGWTQRELADAMGVSLRSVQRQEMHDTPSGSFGLIFKQLRTRVGLQKIQEIAREIADD